MASTRPVHFAIRPRSPTAHPPSSTPAKAVALYPMESAMLHRSPPSVDVAVPTRPTATSVLAFDPGTKATADRYPGGMGPVAARHVAPPSLVSATFTYGVRG